MTVAELRAKLAEMPQEAEVETFNDLEHWIIDDKIHGIDVKDGVVRIHCFYQNQ